MNPINSPLKRFRTEELIPSEEPLQKKSRNSEDDLIQDPMNLDQEISPFNMLVEDVFCKILSNLSLTDSIRFERTSKIQVTRSENYWQTLAFKERFTFTWFQDNESFRDRYLLGKAIHLYIENPPEANQVQSTYNKFSGMMAKFPFFGAYLLGDLKSRAPVIGDQKILKKHIYKLKNDRIEMAGSLLLKGLLLSINLQKTKPENINKLIEKIKTTISLAIEKKVSCSSYLLTKACFNEINSENNDLQKVLLFLADTCSKKTKDFRALDLLLRDNLQFGEYLYNEAESREAPVLASMGINHFLSDQFNSSADFFEEAFKVYNEAEQSIPLGILFNAFLTNSKAGRLEKTAEYFDQWIHATEKDGQVIQLDFLFSAAEMNHKIGRFEKAADYLDKGIQAIEKDGKAISVDLLMKAATTNFHIGRFEKAADYLDKGFQLIERTGQPISAKTWFYAGLTNLNAVRFEKAADNYDRGMQANEKAFQPISAENWLDAGLSNLNAGRYEKAAYYFDQYIQLKNKEGQPIPPNVLKYRELARKHFL